MSKIGVWLVGARGNVATLAMVGAHAIERGVADTTGLVTARPPVSELGLPAVGDLVFGGHDIATQSLQDSARGLRESSGMPSQETLAAVDEDLERIDSRISRGTAVNCGRVVEDLGDDLLEETLSIAEIVSQIRDDYATFAQDHDLDRVVVINVASTEPTLAAPERYDTREAVERAVETDDRDLPASALYAYAALVDGHPYANFTPSTGSALGGLQELAEQEAVPHMGRDGKTGETLVKSALAPMFAGRNLQVRAWEGHNILGNRDGRVLEADENETGKLTSKGGVLDSILGEDMHNAVHIDYTPPLGDWKTAWDYIDFEGFLGTEMKLQFTWEGLDSALAAPLVLDLARLLAHADAAGESGVQSHLASFFKDPLGVDEHDLSRQFARLEAYVERHTDGDPRARR